MTRTLAGGERFNLIFGSGVEGVCWACPGLRKYVGTSRGAPVAKPFLWEDVAHWRSRGARPMMGAHRGLLWQIRIRDKDACASI